MIQKIQNTPKAGMIKTAIAITAFAAASLLLEGCMTTTCTGGSCMKKQTWGYRYSPGRR